MALHSCCVSEAMFCLLGRYCRMSPSSLPGEMGRCEVEAGIGVTLDVGVAVEFGAVVGGDGVHGSGLSLDQLDGAPIFDIPYDENRWPTLRLEAKVRSMLDGISVWGRELYRPVDERSPTIIDHETARAHRMADSLDKDVADGLFDGPLSIAQLLLACALPPYWHWPNAKMDVREGRPPEFQWRSDRSNLSTWIDRFSERPSIQETIPIEH